MGTRVRFTVVCAALARLSAAAGAWVAGCRTAGVSNRVAATIPGDGLDRLPGLCDTRSVTVWFGLPLHGPLGSGQEREAYAGARGAAGTVLRLESLCSP